jgi:glycosyltransferase involved in cell wall biosynthesis
MNNISRKVSCIVPCYKYAKYLPECIESLVTQTYKLHEIIIVSDGSPDNTKEVAEDLIKKYPESNIIFIEKENGGLSSARNVGITRATGDLITSVDADDKLIPGGIEEHVKLITGDRVVAQCALMEFGMRHAVMTPSENTSLERVMQANTMYCNILFPKSAWLEVGGYDESETMRAGYEDWEFNIRLLKAGYKVNTSDFIALRYRVHDNQMTQATAHPQRQKLYKYIYDKHRELYEERNLTVAGLIK